MATREEWAEHMAELDANGGWPEDQQPPEPDEPTEPFEPSAADAAWHLQTRTEETSHV